MVEAAGPAAKDAGPEAEAAVPGSQEAAQAQLLATFGGGQENWLAEIRVVAPFIRRKFGLWQFQPCVTLGYGNFSHVEIWNVTTYSIEIRILEFKY